MGHTREPGDPQKTEITQMSNVSKFEHRDSKGSSPRMAF